MELLSESNVKEITAKFRELKIPCDAIYLDIDYMEGFRCFTWNKEYFPDPKEWLQN
jgi:alpha-glucosidase